MSPDAHIPLLILWSTFNLLSAVGNTGLLALAVLSRCRINSVLVNLQLIFAVTGLSGSLLIWTGHARDAEPPYALCLANAAMSMANVPLQAGAALAMILQGWACVVVGFRPHWESYIHKRIWLPLLIAFPIISGAPLFVAALFVFFFGFLSVHPSAKHDTQIGLEDRTLVYRASPFYCVVNNATIQNASSGLGAAYSFLCLILALWTTCILVSTRRRVRRASEFHDVSYVFVIRTLVFALFVGMAFIVGIIALVSGFSNEIIADVFIASCGPAVFFIFSTSKPIAKILLRCAKPERHGHSLQTSTGTISPIHFKNIHTPGTPAFSPPAAWSMPYHEESLASCACRVSAEDWKGCQLVLDDGSVSVVLNGYSSCGSGPGKSQVEIH
ncbi:hypothetical protein FB45DRAFT_1010104 [Roridomyces roridus]|uniref:Uncharacterized protein n=1 Tax=Roridomyces roridus TaxID=1738132 RepID=A0AAD7FBV6_9AGAR|nr:hypothetical protein FB45DRAFT_1010104 [Roridomyces roridus]